MSDLLQHNRESWNMESQSGESPWCQAVDAATIAAARAGDLAVILTPNKAVPLDWLDGVEGKRVLCLASGGGQQASVLAAAGVRNARSTRDRDRLAAGEDCPFDLPRVERRPAP